MPRAHQQKAGYNVARKTPIERYRNIGISAHIDAGKTTDHRAHPFYTGVSHKIGEVHDGAATMDWMAQSRNAASRSPRRRDLLLEGYGPVLPEHRFNIIDTPGTWTSPSRWERSMRVLDGAVHGVLRGRWRSAAVRDRVASGDHGTRCRVCLRQQDGPPGADSSRSSTDEDRRPRRRPVPVADPHRRRRHLQGRGRSGEDEGDHLGRGLPRA